MRYEKNVSVGWKLHQNATTAILCLVAAARTFKCTVVVGIGNLEVSAKAVLGTVYIVSRILPGATLHIICDGSDAEKAAGALAELASATFGTTTAVDS